MQKIFRYRRKVEYLYKYYFIDNTNLNNIEKIFVQNEVYFSSPGAFNDPFDSKIQLCFKGNNRTWRKKLENLFKQFQPELTQCKRKIKIQEIIDNKKIVDEMPTSYLKEIGIFCMSEKKDNILMWSRYSDNHKGFCLEFKASSNTPFFGRAQNIDYSLRYPNVSYLTASREKQMKAVLLTKAIFWKYEQEWRIIDHDGGSGSYKFSPELLTGVIFGCRMSEEHKNLIKKWIDRRQYKPIIYQAELKQRDFGLNIRLA